MSTQLILYPQSYRGQHSDISTPVFNEYLVQGLTPQGIGATPLENITTSTVLVGMQAILNSTPLIPGNWYRFTTTGGVWANVAAPASSAGNFIFSYNATGSGTGISGVYQQLQNLVPGAVYRVKIQVLGTALSDGPILLSVYAQPAGSSLVATYSLNTTYFTNSIEWDFTATTTNDIFVFEYQSTIAALYIDTMSIQESPETAEEVILSDGQVICDLYEEENIPLTLSIDDFQNVAEQVKSYSKDFNLPATKRNNRIFNNMFDITRDGAGLIFNPYVKTKCVLKQDGFILFEGYLRLIDVKENEGEISYNVNLYSEVIALADTLKDKTFADLDFYELEHDYVISNIKNSWESLGAGNGLLLTNALSTSSFAYDAVTGVNNTQVLKYPFINWTNQITYTNPGVLSNLEVAFRPCIQLKYLINKIFGDLPFSFTSTFFDSAEFEKLFMDFNWGESAHGAADSTNGDFSQAFDATAGNYYFTEALIKYKLQDNTAGDNTLWDNTEYKFTSPVNNLQVEVIYYLRVYNENILVSKGNAVRLAKFNAAGQVLETIAWNNDDIGASSTKVVSGSVTITLNSGDYIQAHGSAPSSNTVRISNAVPPIAAASNIQFIYNNDSSPAWALLNAQRGELGQWDFLKGIMTMFNLVSMVDESNPSNILIETYADVFINNTVSYTTSDLTLNSRFNDNIHDWTYKVDVSQMELKPLVDLDKITIFKFTEDEDDYAFNVYKKSTGGHLYGSKVITADTSSAGFSTIFTGTKEIIAEPFAATVSKALISGFTFFDFVIPTLYARAEDGTCESFNNSPRILYNNGLVSLANYSYTVPAQNEEAAETLPNFLQFSHLSDIPATGSSTDFVFESPQLPVQVATNIPVNNLYQTYWAPYFNELYSPDTRIMTLNVNLNPADIANFRFTDIVYIRNRAFRVNKIEYKPNELSKVEFILLP
jgi:hypothetical protein